MLIEPILHQQIEPTGCQQVALLPFAQHETRQTTSPWHEFVELEVSNLTGVATGYSHQGLTIASPSVRTSNGSQSLPPCFVDLDSSSLGDLDVSDNFLPPSRWATTTTPYPEGIAANRPQTVRSLDAGTSILCRETIGRHQSPVPFNRGVPSRLGSGIINSQSDGSTEPRKGLIHPTSKAEMQKLAPSFMLHLLNDLIRVDEIWTMIKEDKHFKFFQWIFNQATLSAAAAAGRILHNAVRIGARDFGKKALKTGADVESPSKRLLSCTLLQCALATGRIEVAKQLLRFGAAVNLAITSSFVEDPSSRAKAHTPDFTCQCQWIDRQSPVALAADSMDCVDLIPRLLGSGAVLPRCNVLRNAISNGASLDTVRHLIRAGADPNMCTFERIHALWHEKMPLSAAVERLDVAMVDLLLEAKANPDGPIQADFSDLYKRYHGQYWSSPLFAVIRKSLCEADESCEAIVALLLKHGAKSNLSPFDFLESADDPDNSAGPDKIVCGKLCLLYPLQAAAYGKNTGIVSVLLKYQAPLNTQYGTPALTAAILGGRVATTRLLLRAGADPNASGRYSACPSALEAAVMNRDLEMIDLLLVYGADLNQCPAVHEGRTPLQCAAEEGNMQIFNHLVNLGARVQSDVAPTGGISVLQGLVENQNHNHVSWALRLGLSPQKCAEGSRTPLNAAVVNNDRKSLRLLLQAGANVHEYGTLSDGHTKYWEDESSVDLFSPDRDLDYTQILSPIQWASRMDYVKVATILCHAGADVNQESNSNSGDMALHLAAAHGKSAMVSFLVRNGASTNRFSNGRTALIAAVSNAHLEIIGCLLRHGADPNLPGQPTVAGRWPRTPLEIACVQRNTGVVEMLLRRGADPNKGCPLRENLTTSVSIVYGPFPRTQQDKLSRLAVQELLLMYNADVNQRDDDSDTPLQTAISRELFDSAYRLLEKGAKVNAAPSNGLRGRTALQAAATVGEVTMIEHLLSKGAEVNAAAAMDNGVTALQAAAIKGHLHVAQILLEHGADIGAAASPINGRTAIEGAAEFGSLHMVELLLDNYHGPQPVANLIHSAYSAAKRGNQWYVMKRLESYQKDGPPSRA